MNLALATSPAVLSTSTFADAVAVTTADEFIATAERAGYWPTEVSKAPVFAHVVNDGGTFGSYLKAPGNFATVGTFADGSSKVLGVNGGRFTATTPAQWRELCRAAILAGAKPVMGHAWQGRMMAMFEISDANGLSVNLVLGDAFDGTLKLIAGTCVTRSRCANALGMILGADKKKGNAGTLTQIRHTASLEEKVRRLVDGMRFAAENGATVVSLFNRASNVHLTPAQAHGAFDVLFPEAAADATPAAKTRADNARAAARLAGAMPINRVGGRGNLATLWNAATYLVDRREDGSARECRGEASAVGSMCFGTRGERVEVIRHLIEVILADGTVEAMTVDRALAAGVDPSLTGRSIIDGMLEDLN
jgi:hypothetical protein